MASRRPTLQHNMVRCEAPFCTGLQGDTDLEALPTDSLKRVRETYKMMRSVHSSMRSELAAQLEAHRRSSGNGLAQVGGAQEVV